MYNIIFQVGKTAKMISKSTAPHLCPGRFFLGIKSDALLRVRVGVAKLEGQVGLQLPTHPAKHQLHLDAVADDDAQQVVDVAGLDEGGGGKVGLIPHLAQCRVEAETASAGAILNILLVAFQQSFTQKSK